MRAIAYAFVRNEEDIVEESLTHMLEQGLDVFIFDNWSTDHTREIVAEMTYRYQQRLYLERWPAEEPKYQCWDGMLKHIEHVHAAITPDWGLLFGCDELFEAQGGMTVAEYMQMVGDHGYNCIGSVQATFQPTTAEHWQPGMSMKSTFTRWWPGRMHNVRAWKAPQFEFYAGGHDVLIDGKRLYRDGALILRHYPYRNQEQATRKVFVERLPRYDPAEHERGWHTHLDPILPGHNFIHEPDGLYLYQDQESFYQELMKCRTS